MSVRTHSPTPILKYGRGTLLRFIELYSDELGYLDIHPFVLNEDGTSKQADLEGGWYEFEKDYFGSVFFEGKTIPCISLKGQKVFHSGYELRDKDKHDISILESLSK